MWCLIKITVSLKTTTIKFGQSTKYVLTPEVRTLLTTQEVWKKLQDTYPKAHILIVSNSAGTNDDIEYAQAKVLETNTGVSVLRHPTKKPGCYNEILDYFSEQGIQKHQIIVVGDRLFTDILMANMMGSWGLWLSEGVEESQKIFPRLERGVYQRLTDRKFVPPVPTDATDTTH